MLIIMGAYRKRMGLPAPIPAGSVALEDLANFGIFFLLMSGLSGLVINDYRRPGKQCLDNCLIDRADCLTIERDRPAYSKVSSRPP